MHGFWATTDVVVQYPIPPLLFKSSKWLVHIICQLFDRRRARSLFYQNNNKRVLKKGEKGTEFLSLKARQYCAALWWLGRHVSISEYCHISRFECVAQEILNISCTQLKIKVKILLSSPNVAMSKYCRFKFSLGKMSRLYCAFFSKKNSWNNEDGEKWIARLRDFFKQIARDSTWFNDIAEKGAWAAHLIPDFIWHGQQSN